MPKLPDVRKAYIDRMELRKEQLKSLPFHLETCDYMDANAYVVMKLISRARDSGISEDAALIAYGLAIRYGSAFGMVPVRDLRAVQSRRHRQAIKQLFIPHPADPECCVMLPELQEEITYVARQKGFALDGKPLTDRNACDEI